MKKILFIACMVGIYLWQHNGDKPTEVRTAAASTADIVVFTASYCSECKRAKAYMNTNNIAFDEFDVEHDLALRKEFYALGGKGIPFFIIKGQQMTGFNASKFESMR